MRAIERVFLMAGFLCGILGIARAEMVESFSIRTFGNKVKSYVDDELTVHADGTVVLDSFAPFPVGRFYTTTQNQIGRFTGTISVDEVRGLRRLLAKLGASGDEAENGIAQRVVHEVRGTPTGKPISWEQGKGSKLQRQIEHRLARIRQLLLKRPVSALKLMCSSDERVLACAYVNVGTAEVRTVDPLGVSNSVFCLQGDGARRVLHASEVEDPRKMSPDDVVIEPGRSYAFTLNLERPCPHRVVVTTLSLLQNREYSRHLLGELVSNLLR